MNNSRIWVKQTPINYSSADIDQIGPKGSQ